MGVEVAGNGNADLDGDEQVFVDYRSYGDSGAIIVGAGTSDTMHDKHPDSTYGSRVNVQAWGENVVTLGYGDLAVYGGFPDQRYTQSFGITSAAAPMVASACLSLQSYAVDRLCRTLSPTEMRDLLISSGIPQGDPLNGHIGPFVDMQEAIAQLKQLSSDCRFRRGDANDDGVVDLSDCSYISNWFCCGGPAPPCLEAADANDNGQNEPSDAVYICMFLYSGGPPPLDPGPYTCGPDPVNSPENLGCASYTTCP